MRRVTRSVFPLAAAGVLLLAACRVSDAPPAADSTRIVPLGASVAETVYALGAGPSVVAVDASVTEIEAALPLPRVGYVRALSAEGLLSVAPTLVLADTTAGPQGALDAVRQAGVAVDVLPDGQTPEKVADQIRAIALRLGREREGQQLVDTLRARLARAAGQIDPDLPRPRVLFVQGQGGGALGIAGQGTNADALIRLAGAENAFAAVEGYRPMTSEAVVEARPDAIVLTRRTAEVAGGVDALLRRPELALTQTLHGGRIIVLPDAALAFGPSLGDAVLDFQQRLTKLAERPR